VVNNQISPMLAMNTIVPLIDRRTQPRVLGM